MYHNRIILPLLIVSHLVASGCHRHDGELATGMAHARPNNDSLLSAAKSALTNDPARLEVDSLVNARLLNSNVARVYHHSWSLPLWYDEFSSDVIPGYELYFIYESHVDTLLLLRFRLLEVLPRTHDRVAVLYGIARTSMLLSRMTWSDSLPRFAKEFILQCIAEGGHNARVYSTLAACYLRIKEYGKALDAIKESIRLDPTRGAAYMLFGDVQMSMDRAEDAFYSYQTAVRLGFEDPVEYLEMANFYAELFTDHLLEGTFHKSIRIIPPIGKSFFDFGVRFFRKNGVDIAIKLCEKALSMDTTSVGVRVALAGFEDARGNVDKAARVFADAYDISSSDLKQILFASPRVIERVRLSKSGDEKLLALLGTSYRQYGNIDRAIGIFRELLQHRPQDGLPHISLGFCFLTQGDTTRALREFEEAMTREVSDSSVYWKVSNSFLQTGDIEGADEALRRFMVATFDTVKMRRGLGMYDKEMIELNRRGYSKELVTSVLADYFIALDCSWAYENTRGEKWLNGAVSRMERVIKRIPTYTPAYHVLGQTYAVKGDSIRAGVYIRKANQLLENPNHFGD